MIKFIILSLLISNLAMAQEHRQIKIAVIDNGLDLTDDRFKDVLCEYGHEDFTGEGIRDFNGHGTAIAGLIKKYAGNSNYCMIILKYYPQIRDEKTIILNSNRAFSKAIKLNVDFINYSSSGEDHYDFELSILSKFKGKIITAAGNLERNLDINCNVYIACYNLPNVIVVGALNEDNTRLKTSNYGKIVKVWELGHNIKSEAPCTVGGCTTIYSGTSMSTAIYSGKLIKERNND